MLETYADGNCAFNAFALGLRHLVIDKKLDANNLPQELVNNAFGHGKQWADNNNFIKWISEEKDLVKIQTTLAPVLREISINYLTNNSSFLDAAFERAINDFAEHKDTAANPDNVFRRIPNIKQQFEKLTTVPPPADLDATKQQIRDWWQNDGGRNKYFEHMQQPARDANDVSHWGSQVELDALGMIFDVSVRFSKDKASTQVLGCPHGFFKANAQDKPVTLNDDQLKILCGRNILAEKDNGYLLQKDFEQLADEVPHAVALITAVEQHINNHAGTALTIYQWLADANIPKDQQAQVKHLLKTHNAVTDDCALKQDGEDQPDAENIKARITAIDNDFKDYLKKKHKPQQPNFSIDLSGGHWSFSPESITSAKPNPVTEGQPSKTDNVARTKAEQQFKAQCDNLGYKINAAGSVMGKENDAGKRQELITYKKTKDSFELETKAGLNDNIEDIALLMALKLRSQFKTAVVNTTPELAHIYARAFLAAGFEAKNITINTDRKAAPAKEEQSNPMADMMRSMGR